MQVKRITIALGLVLASLLANARTLTAEQNGDGKCRYSYSWQDGKGVAVPLSGERKGQACATDPIPESARNGVALAPSGDQHLCLSDKDGKPVAYYHTVTDRWFSAEGYTRGKRFGATAWGVLVVYFLMVALMGAYFARKEKKADDFFRAGQRVPWYVAGMSIYATLTSAVTFIACPAMVYISDWRYFPLGFATIFLCPLVIAYFIPFFRRLNITCAYEYLERRFDLPARMFASAVFVVFMICRIAVVTLLPAIVLDSMTGIGIDTCILLCGVATILYCTFGGFEAVVWSDFVQGIIMIGGTLAVIYLLAAGSDGGLTGAIGTASAHGKLKFWDFRPLLAEPVFYVTLIGGTMLELFYYIADQSVVQRYVSVKDEKAAGKSVWMGGVASIIGCFLIYVIGTGLWTFYRSHPELTDVVMEKPDGIFPLFIVSEMPGPLSGIMVASIFAATISTLAANLSATSSAATSDFIVRFRPTLSDRAQVRWGQALVVLSGVLGIGAALILARVETRTLFDNFQDFVAMLTAGLTTLFVVGVFLPRIRGRAMMCGLLVGYFATFALKYLPLPFTKPHFLLFGGIGFAVSVAVAWAMSFILPENRRDIGAYTIDALRERT